MSIMFAEYKNRESQGQTRIPCSTAVHHTCTTQSESRIHSKIHLAACADGDSGKTQLGIQMPGEEWKKLRRKVEKHPRKEGVWVEQMRQLGKWEKTTCNLQTER